MWVRSHHNHYQGSDVASILRPVHGVREEMKARGVQPKDHRRENRQQLKEIQRVNRLNAERKENESQELFKMARFKNVTSKVKPLTTGSLIRDHDHDVDGEVSCDVVNGNRTSYLKAHTLNERLGQRREQLRQRIQSSKSPDAKKERRPPVPKKDEVLKLETRKEKNFLQENRQNAQQPLHTNASSSHRETEQVVRHTNYGKVPEYIIKRNKQRHQREELERMEMEYRSECPPGMTIMDEHERLETVDILKQSYEKLNRDLHSMSIVSDSLKLRKKREQLERKLKEVEEAISVFSKNTVYIAE